MEKSKVHWESVYAKKELTQCSWYQKQAKTSLEWILGVIPQNAHILDIGGGNSYFVDNLRHEGYHNITVLDISQTAINQLRARLGSAQGVDYIVGDILKAKHNADYDLIRDRAVFHFITDEKDKLRYKEQVLMLLKPKAYFMVATFSPNGPTQCSNLPVQQYSVEALGRFFGPELKPVASKTVAHRTPSDTIQEFTYVLFRKV